MIRFEFRARCLKCATTRTLWSGEADETGPQDLDRLDESATGTQALCPACGAVEQVAMWCNGVLTEPWRDADEYERENGPEAGPLPPRPWKRRTN